MSTKETRETATGTGERGFFVEAYASRFGEPRFKQEAQGYWLFVAGVVLGLLGLFMLAFSTMPEPRTSAAFGRRQFAGILGGVGLPLLMLGAVYRLPVKRKVDRVALLGTLVCLAAIVAFVVYYPGNWNIPSGGQGADYAVPITGLYGVGLLIIGVAALVLPYTTTTREEVVEPVEEPAPEPEPEPEPAEEPAKSKAKFELYKDRKGEWRWNLRHNNGNIIADSAEGYSSKQKAKQGMESVRKNTAGAPVTEREEEPEEVAAVAEEEGADAGAEYELYEDNSGDWRWRLVASNGRIIADSAEGYSSKGAAEDAIDRIRERAPEADHLDITPAGFEVYKDKAEEWRWRLIRQNGRIIADGGEGYTERNDAMEAVERVQSLSGETEVYEDDGGDWRWRHKAPNGKIVADSAEGYSSEGGAEEATEKFENVAPDADAVEKGKAYFTVYKDEAKEWRWRLVASNGRIVADSGEGYTERNDCVEALDRVRKKSRAPTV